MRKRNLKKVARILEGYFAEKQPRFGNSDSVLESLYWLYTEYNNLDNDRIREKFSELRKLSSAHDQEGSKSFSDSIFTVASELSLEYSRVSFVEGIRLGFVLLRELEQT